MSRKSSAR